MKFRSMSSIVLAEPPRLQTDSSREYLEIELSDLKFGEPVEKGGRVLKALWISQNKTAAVKMLSNLNDRAVSSAWVRRYLLSRETARFVRKWADSRCTLLRDPAHVYCCFQASAPPRLCLTAVEKNLGAWKPRNRTGQPLCTCVCIYMYIYVYVYVIVIPRLP